MVLVTNSLTDSRHEDMHILVPTFALGGMTVNETQCPELGRNLSI